MTKFKIVKVTLYRGELGQQQVLYPKRYNPEEVDRYGVGPMGVGVMVPAYSRDIFHGNELGACLIMLPVKLAEEYAKDERMEIIKPEEADALLDEWAEQMGLPEEIITDRDRIEAIAAKQRANIPLTLEDRQALDPESDVPGIQRRRKPIKGRWAKRGIEVD